MSGSTEHHDTAASYAKGVAAGLEMGQQYTITMQNDIYNLASGGISIDSIARVVGEEGENLFHGIVSRDMSAFADAVKSLQLIQSESPEANALLTTVRRALPFKFDVYESMTGRLPHWHQQRRPAREQPGVLSFEEATRQIRTVLRVGDFFDDISADTTIQRIAEISHCPIDFGSSLTYSQVSNAFGDVSGLSQDIYTHVNNITADPDRAYTISGIVVNRYKEEVLHDWDDKLKRNFSPRDPHDFLAWEYRDIAETQSVLRLLRIDPAVEREYFRSAIEGFTRRGSADIQRHFQNWFEREPLIDVMTLLASGVDDTLRLRNFFEKDCGFSTPDLKTALLLAANVNKQTSRVVQLYERMGYIGKDFTDSVKHLFRDSMAHLEQGHPEPVRMQIGNQHYEFHPLTGIGNADAFCRGVITLQQYVELPGSELKDVVSSWAAYLEKGSFKDAKESARRVRALLS